MDRSAAKEVPTGFMAGKTLSANHIEFANLVVDHPTEHGFLSAQAFFESPFTDFTPQGPDQLLDLLKWTGWLMFFVLLRKRHR